MNTTLRKSMSMVAAAVGVTAAIALAPSAQAASSAADCRQSGGATVCQKPGHTSLHTKPTVRTPAGSLFSSPWLPGYGRGQLPPMLALD